MRQGGFGFEWTDNGGLRKWNVMSPFKLHPVTGEKLWVNMIVSNHASYFHDHPSFPELLGKPYLDGGDGSGFEYPFTVKYGDGSPVPYSTIQLLRKLAWEGATAPAPLDGDLLVVDNYAAQHGRLGCVDQLCKIDNANL